MNNIVRKLKFHYKEKLFVKKYIQFNKKALDYDQFLEVADTNEKTKTRLWCVEVFDVLDNYGVGKVIKKLYSLKKKKELYKIEVNYRKSLFFNLQYTNVQIDYTSISVIGKIGFKQNKYIRDIVITMTQINNNEFILCYTIHLKKMLQSYRYLRTCIQDNLDTIIKNKSFTWYINDKIFQSNDYKDVLKLEHEWLRDWFQGIIDELFYSNIGKIYKLPILFI